MVLLKKLFGAIFGLFAALGKLLGLGKKGEFYVEIEPTTPLPKPVPAVEPEPTTAVAAPTPEPVATVEPSPVAPTAVEPTVTEAPSRPYAQFARRRPGANMANFVAMARQVRPST